jgi:glutamine amidotransferase
LIKNSEFKLTSIIDYNIGNISAVVNMLQRLGLKCRVARSIADIEQADQIILPGNGAFDACIRNLRASGLIPVLEKQVLEIGKPLLGICVGAQMLGHGSAEGVESGLGWIDMRVERFPELSNLRVPHMGWNHVVPCQKEHQLAENMTVDTRFYFVHSYYMLPKNTADILFQTHYGIDFAAGVAQRNIMGVQFHPEKSHRFGKKLLNAFVNWKP